MKTMLATLIAVSTMVWSLSLSTASAQEPETDSVLSQSRALAQGLTQIVANGGAQLLNTQAIQHGGNDELPGPFIRWIKAHQHTLVNAGPTPFKNRSQWGEATVNGNQLFLHITTWPQDGKLLIPRLHNSILSAKLIGENEVKVKPNVMDWELSLGQEPVESVQPVVELTLNEPARRIALTDPPVVLPRGPVIELHSRYAIVHGEMLRFEPQPHKNTVGYWVKENDWAEWKCKPAKAGQYQVELRYGCGNGQGGSEIEISIGDQKLPFQVEATGGFQSWRDVKLGTVNLRAQTDYEVSAKVRKKAKNAVMDIQQITLRFVE